MKSLRTVLALNMKKRRSILGITQARLAERVNTSTNYIALIETQKKFPKPEMLERIAAALEIEPPALFTPETRLLTEAETLARVQKQILGDVTKAISVSFKKFEGKTPQSSGPDGDSELQMV